MAVEGTIDSSLLKTYHWINGRLVGKNMYGTWDDESLNNRIMSKTADSGIDEQQRQANEWRGPHTNQDTGEVYYCGDPGPELLDDFIMKQWQQPKPILCISYKRTLSRHQVDAIRTLIERRVFGWRVLVLDSMSTDGAQAFMPNGGTIQAIDTNEFGAWLREREAKE